MVNHIHITYSDHSAPFPMKTYPHSSLQKYISDFFQVTTCNAHPESLTVVLAVSWTVSGLSGRLARASNATMCHEASGV